MSTSLLMLNNFCLLEIFKYLGLDDFISLSRACQHLKSIAELFNRMYTDFKININLDDKDNDYVEHVIANMNTEVTEISIDYSNSKIPMNVRKMTECCGADVKSLRISNWTVDVTDSDNRTFYNLETLTMTDCEFQSVPSEFFELFSGLKAVNFCGFQHWSNEFSKKLFCKNPDIESFVWMGDMKAFDEFELFEKLPKLAALSMKVDMKVNEFHIGTAFGNLTKLQLYCNGDNISKFLHKLGKSTEAPALRELELLCVNVDESLFSALHHFRQLEHLAMLTWNYWELQSSALWPNKIKFLRLRSFIISMDCFMSTIKDWEHLVHIDIVGCTISRADRHFFEDSQKLSHAISTALEGNTKQVDFILRERDYVRFFTLVKEF